MYDLGYTWDSKALSEPAEKRVDYPEICLRAKDGKDLPDLPKGEFYFLAKGRVTGFRDPVESHGTKSVDITVMSLQPIEDSDATGLIRSEDDKEGQEDSYEETANSAFRESLKEIIEGQIGSGAG